MHKSATKCNKIVGKWCKNKNGASKIIDTLEMYQLHLWRLVGEWINPFGSELSQSLALDYLSSFEGDLEGLKLHGPFCYPPGNIGIA
jgi:hypothetical protein